MISYASLLLSNQYLRKNLSIKKWLAQRQELTLTYHDGPLNGQSSAPLNYHIFSKSTRELGGFEPEKLNLMEQHCDWMDGSMEIKLNFHITGDDGIFSVESGDLQNYYGKDYPLKPALQREGRLYTSYQPQLIRRIIKDRNRLIQNSSNALDDDWVFDLRDLISNVISLVEIAFTQLYIKAEFDPLPGWKFSKDKLGERHARRTKDKFKWVYQITGQQLNIEAEMPSFDNLRELRNHLMHFDPPSFVITIEEATIWLNQILDVAMILIKMRLAIGVAISKDLINMALQPEAIFVPGDNTPRKPIDNSKNENYASSIWPKK
ncbi:hypothetical protein ACHMWN_08625 [Pedobacter sp. UC225_61]|uniref:hypothetical protein n=1 Tax=Pedobacter sp. UC225_61 TaxID=3374623 RepID=UPI0037919433